MENSWLPMVEGKIMGQHFLQANDHHWPARLQKSGQLVLMWLWSSHRTGARNKNQNLHSPEEIAARLNLIPVIPEIDSSLFNLGSFFRGSILGVKRPGLPPNKVICTVQIRIVSRTSLRYI